MNIQYKTDEYYKSFVGKYLILKYNDETSYDICKIISYDCRLKKFKVENCYLTLGSGFVTLGFRNYFIVDSGYWEIKTPEEYKETYQNIKYLCTQKKNSADKELNALRAFKKAFDDLYRQDALDTVFNDFYEKINQKYEEIIS